MEHTGQGFRGSFRQKRIRLRLVHQGKQPLWHDGELALLTLPFVLVERDVVEWFLGGRQMKDIRLSIEDHRQMILCIGSQRPNGEIEIPRCERDEESGVFLFLGGNGFRIQAGDFGREHDRRRSGLLGHRDVVDDEFIEWLLGDGAGPQSEREQQWDEQVFHARNMAGLLE